jgi:probable F420-dependent oxidoreductase
MKVDALLGKDIAALVPEAAARAREGFDALWLAEAQYDPFLQCLEVARAAPGSQIGTAIAVAFARSPMTLANVGYDLARYTDGRFILGLGPQIKPHIDRRFSMPWSHPARRMRELVLAIQAIWACWQDGTPLDFHGEFYTHTLMTPNFAPPPHSAGPPPIYLAGVGERMTEIAGEVADGRYLREVTLPALERGRARADADRSRPEVGGLVFVAAGRDDAELDTAIAGVRYRIAFYGSTPAYKPVLEMHGWGDLQPQLNALAKQGRWREMADLVPDEVLHELAAVGTPEQAARALAVKYGPVADRVTLDMPYKHHPETKLAVAQALRAATSRSQGGPGVNLS